MSRFIAVFHLRSTYLANRGFKVHALRSTNHTDAYLEASDIRVEQLDKEGQYCNFTVVEIEDTPRAPRRLTWLERITGNFEGRC